MMALGGILNAKEGGGNDELENHFGVLVILASKCGLPVSTTHVSVGALFGVGLTARKAKPAVLGIALWWAFLGAPVYSLVINNR